VRGELFGERDRRAEREAAKKEAEATRPKAPTEDAYWSYVAEYN
jgi:hypothetical protein